MRGRAGADDGWNFGPDRSDERPVRELAEAVQMALGSGTLDYPAQHSAPHEATLLQLDSTKARRLGWRPRLDFASTVAMTADWYGGWAKGAQAAALCVGQIESYMELCEDV